MSNPARQPYSRSPPVFCQMVRDERTSRVRKIQDLVRARDKFYLNHTTITPDRARDFVLSTTEKCASDESARAVACALLSLRDASLLEPFLVFVIKNRIPFYDVVVEALCEAVRKYFENFTKEASENALDIFSILARVGGPTEMPFKTNFAVSLVSNYDTGWLTRGNLKMIGYFTRSVENFKEVWCELEAADCLLVIKILRFYQDMFVLQETQQEQSFDKNLRDIIAKAQSIASSFGPVFVGFFEKSLPTIVKLGFREIIRILYDPRTYRRMQARFPAIYNMVMGVKESEIISGTVPAVIQVMMPYQKMCALLDFSRTYRQEECPSARILFERTTPLYDIDLIISDIARVMLQSPDYEAVKPDERYRCLSSVYRRAMGTRNVIPRSFVQAIISDLLYINPAYLGDRVYQGRVLVIIFPFLFFVRETATIGNWIVDAIMGRLAQDDHREFKRNSFREVINFVKRASMPDICEILVNMPHVDASKRQELANLLKPKETDIIPVKLLNFHKSGAALASGPGHEMIKLTNELVMAQIGQSHGKLVNAIGPILSIMDTLVPRDRADLELVFDRVNTIACALFSSRKLEDARRYLEWAYTNKETTAFKEAGLFKLSMFVDVLRESVVQRTELWRYFVVECPIMRNRVTLLQTICDYCPTSVIMDLAELPFLPDDNSSGIFSQALNDCKGWTADGQIRLTLFLAARLQKPTDFDVIAEPLITVFEKLPAIVRSFFEDLLSMARCDSTSRIYEGLRKSAKSGTAEFCQKIRDAWTVSREAPKLLPHSSAEVIVL